MIFTAVGSWTLKSKKHKRGAEPDECYIFGKKKTNRPDLAIEVEWSSGGIDKLDVYRKLGVHSRTEAVSLAREAILRRCV